MIEYCVLAFQLCYKPPNIDFQEAVLQALTRPKIVAVAGTHQPQQLEQIVIVQAGGKEVYTQNQARSILERPYLDPQKNPTDSVYNDLIAKGNVIKYILNELTTEELRNFVPLFIHLPVYLSKSEAFGDYLAMVVVNSNERILGCLQNYRDKVNKAIREKGLEGASPQIQKYSIEVEKCGNREEARANKLASQLKDLTSMRKEIARLVKAKGII